VSSVWFISRWRSRAAKFVGGREQLRGLTTAIDLRRVATADAKTQTSDKLGWGTGRVKPEQRYVDFCTYIGVPKVDGDRAANGGAAGVTS
jgi:hypothetical protein